jgi:hypothetical protein
LKNTVLTLGLLAVSALARASEPVQSADALEREVIACVMKDAKTGKCMETVLGPKILPGNDGMVSVAQQMDELLTKWLASDTVYAVHPISTKTRGDIFEARKYVIEDTTGSVMILDMALLKRLGKWYVYSMNLSSTKDEISKLFDAD